MIAAVLGNHASIYMKILFQMIMMISMQMKKKNRLLIVHRPFELGPSQTGPTQITGNLSGNTENTTKAEDHLLVTDYPSYVESKLMLANDVERQPGPLKKGLILSSAFFNQPSNGLINPPCLSTLNFGEPLSTIN